jgi:hypothetical protein
VSDFGPGHGIVPAIPAAIACAALRVGLLVERGGRQELRAPETWALAALLAVAGFVIVATHLVSSGP